MKKYFLFDLDGTLTDPFEGITRCVEYALNRYGVEVKDRRELAFFIGPPLAPSFEKYLGISTEESFRAVEIYRERFSTIGLFENEVYEGVDNMLRSLKESGANIVLATSKPKVFADRILDKFDLMKYFVLTDGSELDGTRVNKDEVIEHAITTLDCKKDECVMIGDRKHDIIGAKKNGIESVGVLYGYGDMAELTEAGAHHIARDVAEVSRMLMGMIG